MRHNLQKQNRIKVLHDMKLNVQDMLIERGKKLFIGWLFYECC